MKRNYWSKEQIEQLKILFPNTKTDEISKMMGLNYKSIVSKANRLKLKKTKEHKSKMISERNKMIGRDLSLQNLKKISKKYKTKGQFQLFDPSAYTTARKTEHMEEICSHMIKSTSIPQLIMTYIIKSIFKCDIKINDRIVLKPYELDVYLKKYNIGFEYDGKLWHENIKNNDTIKNKLCEKNNILLIRISENNRNYVEDIKLQIINNLSIINSFTKLNIISVDIQNINNIEITEYVNSQILDDEEIKKIISKYTNYHDFIINEQRIYQKLLRMKSIDKYLSKLNKDRIYWNDNKIILEVNKYKTLSDFIKKSYGCYLYCKKNKKEYLYEKLEKKCSYFSIDQVISEIEKYEYLSDFRLNSKKFYSYIKRYKKYELIKNLKRKK